MPKEPTCTCAAIDDADDSDGVVFNGEWRPDPELPRVLVIARHDTRCLVDVFRSAVDRCLADFVGVSGVLRCAQRAHGIHDPGCLRGFRDSLVDR